MQIKRYEKPKTVRECLELSAQFGPSCRFLAGGTDLIPRIKSRKIVIDTVVDITGVEGLYGWQERSDGTLYIGAATRLGDIHRSIFFRKSSYNIIAVCAGHISSIAVRNMGTIGGNTCNASPCADSVPALLMLDAKAVVASFDGVKKIPIDDFFLAPGKTKMQEGDLLLGFEIDKPKQNSIAKYEKYSIRGDSDIAIVGTGAMITLDEHNHVVRSRLAIASAAPTPIRCKRAESLMLGEVPRRKLIAGVANMCAKESSPISDHRASADYRRDMIKYFMERALNSVIAEIK